MKFLFAPDSFKGSFTSMQVIEYLEKYSKKYFPQADIIRLPVADGGEGTVDAIVASLNGEYEIISVTGPLGEKTDGKIAYINQGKTAIIEMAQATGLDLVGDDKNPLEASSFGTGEMIDYVLRKGIQDIVIGIGGSATNDGGIGALAALGVSFFADNKEKLSGKGKDLIKIKEIDLGDIQERLENVKVTVMCDVSNPLLGPNGATYIYGPQKGVGPKELEILEQGMENYINIAEKVLGKEVRNIPGAGAAGGIGAALIGFMDAQLESGIDYMLDLMKFDELLKETSLVITGEGKIDYQSINFGKLPYGIINRCKAQNVPVALIAGSMESALSFDSVGYDVSVMTSISEPIDLKEALKNAEATLESAIERMFVLLKTGYHLHLSQ